ncbi:GumC family protein [Christiangramia sp. OXR-203]|jgi:capsular exopolysaccharide synthesis family protein|uniref:GumC family protein n=1 Tax=Christiangramia sp. OXR-203 TaxID=3100176 RepID=UPI002AC9C49C|nr:polysaccharide biosynthesis tyrosine autokinase [Christiangramia sp. OXR-203]WPY98244.1 polysaccharide biosynthesis tyrosine autokinase [Christiangramia sp. OXR-203]
MSQTPQYTPRPQEEEINLREELEKYLKYWPWFLLAVIVCVALAFTYLKFTTASYNTTASIIIKDEDSKGASSEMSAFVDLGLLSGMGTNSIENEIGILKSRRMMTEVVKALQLNVQYIDESGIPAKEVYLNSPVLVQILKLDEQKLKDLPESEYSQFHVSRSANEFLLTNSGSGKTLKAKPGVPVDVGFATIVLNPQDEGASEVSDLKIQFSTIEGVASVYRSKVMVNLTDKNSSLIELSLEDPVKAKARDILNQLILEYNREAIEDKNLVARNTAKFIDERLSIINEELDSVETGKEEFKQDNNLTDIQAESSLFIENASEFNKRQQEMGTQVELANAMIEYLRNGSEGDLLPANLGISEQSVNQRIQEYNDLVLERNRILSGSTAKNPIVISLNNQIDQIKANVLQSLQRMRDNMKIAQEDLNRQSAVIGSKISAVPGKERLYRGIERQQNIKESLYLFLLQKREENSLSLAVTAPKAKIVDSAYSSDQPVSPKPKIILLAALILGMLIPFLIIYISQLLNNKIQNRADLDKVAKEIPVVGEIPKVKRGDKDLVDSKIDRSILAEAFRILHTNLQYLLANKGDKKTGIKIFITSTVKGEGKTFAAFNLAVTLANTGKKVVIVGADLRNPQLQRYEAETKSMLGVSDYLINNSHSLENLIKQSALHSNLSLLSSGSIPPNPAELWRLDKSAQMFAELETGFDYVIVDTAPSMLVADTFLINKYADLTLYMVRAGYTEKKLQEFALDAKRDGKLHDVGFVLNDVELSNFGYGNKYGYVYGQEEKSFWNKLRGKAMFW